MLVKIDATNPERTEAYCHIIDDFETISEANRCMFCGDDPVMIIELDGTIYAGDRKDILDIGEEQIIRKVGGTIFRIRLDGDKNE